LYEYLAWFSLLLVFLLATISGHQDRVLNDRLSRLEGAWEGNMGAGQARSELRQTDPTQEAHLLPAPSLTVRGRASNLHDLGFMLLGEGTTCTCKGDPAATECTITGPTGRTFDLMRVKGKWREVR
jgi:hypothetical protein